MDFEETEYRQRTAKVQAALAAAGVAAGVIVNPELICYLTGYDAHTHFSRQALVLGLSGDPAFILRDVDVPVAEDVACVRDLRPYHFGGAKAEDLVAGAVREKAGTAARVGVDLRTYALPGDYAFALQTALAPGAIVDVSATVNAVRLTKSDSEIAYVRKAAEYAEAGLVAARRVVRAGITEIELAAAIEAGMRAAGSEYGAMPTWVGSGPRNRGGHRTPTRRVLEKGDMVKVEFAGVHARYHAVTMQTFSIGEPSQVARRIYDAARDSLAEGTRLVRPGAPVAGAERRAVEVLRGRGFDPHDMARFGYGVGLQFPPTWLEGLEIIVESEQVFTPNMSFVLHTSLKDAAAKTAALVGGAYVTTATGVECLSGGPLDLFVA